MCNFFSFCADGHGNYLYEDWKSRVALKHVDVDSHTAILTRAKIPPKKQEEWSFYEYNPLTKAFRTDKAVEGHDIEAARNWVESRDWETIVEPLIIKPIVNPLSIRPPKITKTHIKLLKDWASVVDSVRDSVVDSVWASVWDSVRASVWASVRASVVDSVRDSVWASVWDSVRDSVWDSVRDSVWDSVWASVRASVWASVRDSVWASVVAYISTFFKIKYKYDLSSATKLWDAGLVPSFDDTIWRLHGGKEAKVLYEMKAKS